LPEICGNGAPSGSRAGGLHRRGRQRRALALGVGNIVLMLENAVYSVISPESCAAIIYRDSGKAEQPPPLCG